MTTRVLPRDEWPRLADRLTGALWSRLDAQFAEVLVAERDGEIVASALLLNVLHAECVESTGVAAGRALWRLLRERVAARNAKAIWGAAIGEPMHGLLSRHAEPIVGSHFLVRM